MREQFEALEHHADVPADLARFASLHADLLAVEQDAASVDRLQSVDAAQQRRFAGSAWADDADDLALVGGQRDAA